MVDWCAENNLEVKVLKTKEMAVNFKRKKTSLVPLRVNELDVQMVESFNFLASTISNTLRWEDNTKASLKVHSNSFTFLRQLKKFGVNKTIMYHFYRAITECVMAFSSPSGTVKCNPARQEQNWTESCASDVNFYYKSRSTPRIRFARRNPSSAMSIILLTISFDILKKNKKTH